MQLGKILTISQNQCQGCQLTNKISFIKKKYKHQVTTRAQIQQEAMITKKLFAKNITQEEFAPFGQVCEPQEDGKPYDQEDAQLDLQQGTPRFYVMRLPFKGLQFDRITHHAKVTQCLGSLNPPQPWYICVCEAGVEKPTEDKIKAFKVPHGVFIKMEKGTWHAGPFFNQEEWMDFYNLELDDTNVVDHNTVVFSEEGYNFQIIDQ
eukprot:TRINITY_DN19070_c2_g1_i4.p1 TRINITY_DN19070_c2_g1~~TRINITY_DN19070_c2_g1_i4.p1  ORF type:complete len:225 (-),score=17.26 TRINITY_DN19070_c2_g1_i4:335-952(-)